jgi:hypothetical protein
LPILIGIGIHAWFSSRSDIWPVKPTLEFNVAFLVMWVIVAQLVGFLLLPVLLQNAFAGREGRNMQRAGSSHTEGSSSRSQTAGTGKALLASLTFPASCLLVAVGLVYWGKHLLVMQKVVPGDSLEPWFPYTMPMLGPFGPFSAVIGFGPLYLPGAVRQVLTFAGVFAAGAVIARLLGTSIHRLYSSPIIAYSSIQGLLFILAPRIYDRYFLVLLPGAMAAIAARADLSIVRRRIGWIGLAAMAIFSVAVMHDWLSWNEARWALGKKAVASGIHPWEIEGGLEWNGWYGPENGLDLPPASGPLPEVLMLYNFDLHFFHIIDRYCLGATQPVDMVVRDRRPYSAWLPPRRCFAFLLEHTNRAPGGSADFNRAVKPPRTLP